MIFRISIKRLVLFIILLLSVCRVNAQQEHAAYVWKDNAGKGRQQLVFFRRSFECQKQVTKAWISLFADSRYQLFVNGTFVNFGPVRFNRASPEYDSLNIAPYLKEGKNTIAVKVLSNGMETFQVPYSIGGFKAWGKISTSGEQIDLNTPGDWKYLTVQGYDENALRVSFALGAQEIYDQRKDPVNWKDPGFDESSWKTPFLITKQDHWGRLAPRSIPFLTNAEKVPFLFMGAYPLSKGEQIYSFRRNIPDERHFQDYQVSYRFLAYTYVFSPKQQTIDAGCFWGSYYLNGDTVSVSDKSKDALNPVRNNYTLHLKAGWNYLVADLKAMWGGWEFYLALPDTALLKISADKNFNTGIIFQSTQQMYGSNEMKEFEVLKKEIINLGSTGKDKFTECKNITWVKHLDSESANAPARELVWRHPDIEHPVAVKKQNYYDFSIAEPTTYVFDMGGKILGRIFIEAEAPEGTVIDIGWSEVLNDQGMPWIYKNNIINTGACFVTANGKDRYETFKPYGLRYLQILVTPPAGKSVRLKKVGVMVQEYPFEKKGSFECSDPLFNKIWEMGWRTLRVCAEDSYTDTPFRERGHYAGDALPEFATTLATSGDARLMRRSIELLTQMYHDEMWEGKQNRHNEFPVILLVSLKWYTDYTGDLSLAEKYYPDFKSLMNHVLGRKNEAGYISFERVFYEWVAIDRGDDLAGVQALIVRALNDLADLADMLGHNQDSDHFREEGKKLQRVVVEKFWDGQKRAFFDGYHGQSKVDAFHLTSSSIPLLYDVSTPDQNEDIVHFLCNELDSIGEMYHQRKTTPYGGFYVLASLYKQGRADIAEKFIRDYWARMIYYGDDTAWEHFDLVKNDGTEGGTASHAWSSHPTYFLSTEVLGVSLGYYREFEPDKILIEPQSATLSWAKGNVPHPLGLVHVEWQIKGDILDMNIEVPDGGTYEVRPKGRLANYQLFVNGMRIKN